MEMLGLEWRKRLIPHAVVIFAFWPLLSVFAATKTLKDQAVAYFLPWFVALAGNLFAAVKMAPEFLAVGLLLYLVSTLSFAAIASLGATDASPKTIAQTRVLEPILLLFACCAGVLVEYPAALRHPLILPLWILNVFTATGAILLGAIAAAFIIGRALSGKRGAFATVALTIALVVSLRQIAALPPMRSGRDAGPKSIVLLGIDSLAQNEDVRILRRYAETRGGTWFEHPVSPGLMTNPVWTSLLLHRPVSETGVFLVRQPVDWSKAPFTLVKRARELGYTSWSFFSDQFTTYVGSDAGFDRNRSGPRGWLQVATTGVKDASVLLPLLLPRLPEIPFASTPRNQAGTYCFDVIGEINAILTAGSATPGGDFIAAHLDYLHQPRYPRYSEMSAREAGDVRWVPVWDIRDPSLDFNYPPIKHDPLKLYAWKLQNIQKLVTAEIEQTKFLAPEKANRLVILSDHGNRAEMEAENFGREEFYRVVFIGFGTAPRDAQKPISLLDAAELVGLDDPTRRGAAEPIVEFTSVTNEEWEELVKTARLRWNGDSGLNGALIASIGKRLLGYRPHGEPAGYFPSPVRQSMEALPLAPSDAATASVGATSNSE